MVSNGCKSKANNSDSELERIPICGTGIRFFFLLFLSVTNTTRLVDKNDLLLA